MSIGMRMILSRTHIRIGYKGAECRREVVYPEHVLGGYRVVNHLGMKSKESKGSYI